MERWGQTFFLSSSKFVCQALLRRLLLTGFSLTIDTVSLIQRHEPIAIFLLFSLTYHSIHALLFTRNSLVYNIQLSISCYFMNKFQNCLDIS